MSISVILCCFESGLRTGTNHVYSRCRHRGQHCNDKPGAVQVFSMPSVEKQRVAGFARKMYIQENTLSFVVREGVDGIAAVLGHFDFVYALPPQFMLNASLQKLGLPLTLSTECRMGLVKASKGRAQELLEHGFIKSMEDPAEGKERLREKNG
ncbi:hypothetical protein FISHEDRAFT_58026 [Fistulina hepatica ATCC 64428]|uniref:Uncharacterized protein n=1 Tax=Fistulina hepatica ATCC 64428 TaxID=1128425 RepID=A0A0D7AHI2_9AGAR|nr:hypothetical protein FISHEDRAFT_58026 [Fistulina hepatica ATCC 64428]